MSIANAIFLIFRWNLVHDFNDRELLAWDYLRFVIGYGGVTLIIFALGLILMPMREMGDRLIVNEAFATFKSLAPTPSVNQLKMARATLAPVVTDPLRVGQL
jgi:hypothetical protein